ncbi:MAG: lipid-A-disaccharide synthase [Bergeyella sp.]|nr:lipid-A-disaccharide synthase [Bergeyella sp.]
MKYYIISGEASGDLHAGNLMSAIKNHDPRAEFRFWGGDHMKSQGGEQVKHYRDLAFMGFWEVILNLRVILKNIRFCKRDIENYRPDVLILVDYPGFNLRIAKFAHQLKIKVVYYISPQLWAWREGRIKTIKKYVDKVLVILPFEEKFYKDRGVEAIYVGHPLLDALSGLVPVDEQKFREEYDLGEKKIIALLPGSRKQEIARMLKIMLSSQLYFTDYAFVIAGAPGLSREFYEPFLTEHVSFVSNRTYDLLGCSYAALVTSGTATLETALLNVPEVVCYKGNAVSYKVAKRLIKNIKYISLVNLIMGREVVRELIQNEFNTQNLTTALKNILSKDRERILGDYDQLRNTLGKKGASGKAAIAIMNLISEIRTNL